MSKLSTDEILDAIGDMSVMELVDLKKQFEDRFEVTAVAAPAAAPAGGAADGGDADGEDEEQSAFTVVITAMGDKKIQVIKEVRSLTGLGLKEAKDLVEGAPKPVLEGVPKEEADKAREALEGVGAGVEIS